jgi:adenylyl-sulfate kinase
MKNGHVIWFTGLSGSGKSTLSEMLITYLKRKSMNVLLLDGDIIRSKLNISTDFSPDKIKENSQMIINVCKKKSIIYDYIIVSVIAPYEETRKYARKILGSKYFEVFVKVSLKKLISRDTKGLYKKALSGELENLIGFDSNTPYETPTNPNLIIDTEFETKEESFSKLVDLIESK